MDIKRGFADRCRLKLGVCSRFLTEVQTTRDVYNDKVNTNHVNYYSTNSRDAHTWSESHCYPSSVHNRYPAIYVGRQDSS